MNNYFRKYNNKLIKVVFADPSDYDSRFDEKFDPVKCCAIGWLVNETKDCLRLAWLLDEIDGPSAGVAIPSGSVISIQHISGVKKERGSHADSLKRDLNGDGKI
jgi:hypothetical protein